MSATYVFRYTADEALLCASMRATPPHSAPVRGARVAKLLHLLHCTLLVLGGLCVGYGASHLLVGTPTLLNWGTALGILLSYVAIFGSVFVTLPVMVRKALVTRANDGAVELRFDASGITTTGKHFRSTIDWSGIEGVTRGKLGFIVWFGGNRPAVPFAAFDSAAHQDAFEVDVNKWLEASR